MSQLGELARQGKLNAQQIQQVRMQRDFTKQFHRIHLHLAERIRRKIQDPGSWIEYGVICNRSVDGVLDRNDTGEGAS